MNKVGTIELETERLNLRKLTRSDASAMYNNWAKDPEVSKYLAWDYHENIDVSKELLDMWVEEYKDLDTYRWGIELKENGQLIGTIDIVNKSLNDETCEIGYVIGRQAWGKGIMTEALQAVLKFLFEEAGFYLINLKYIDVNIGSGRVMEKNNLPRVAVLPEFAKNKVTGGRGDLIVHAININQWRELNK